MFTYKSQIMGFKYLSLFFFFTGIITFVSCGSESIPSTLDEDNLLYPLEIGNYWEYASDSVVYSQNGMKRDTMISFIKEEITDAIINGSPDTSYVITRSYKKEIADPWQVSDIWTASRIGNLITKTEENLKFVKLDLPITLGKTWDGNRFFDEFIDVNIGAENLQPYKNWESIVLSTTETVIANNITYDDVIKIQLVDQTQQLIDYRYVVEWYAPSIGLIKKELIILESQNAELSNWINTAEKGVVHHLELIAHN